MDNREASDANIISKSLAHPEVFGMIFDRHHETIFRYVARRQGLDQAPDLTADVFVRAFRFRARYDATRPNCRPWLYGIATNVVGDEIRRQRRANRLYLAGSGVKAESPDPYDQSVDKIDAQRIGRVLNDGLARLSTTDRNVLILYAVEQLTYQEVADALGTPIGTVRSRLARARRKLREHEGLLTALEPSTPDHPDQIPDEEVGS